MGRKMGGGGEGEAQEETPPYYSINNREMGVGAGVEPPNPIH